MRLSGAMDSDQCVAVTALVEQSQIELERRPPVALGHYPGAGNQNRSQRRRELRPEGARVTIWGIEEHEIVKTSVARCAPEVSEGVLAAHLGLGSERIQVAAQRGDGGARGVDENGVSGSTRKRLETQPTRPGEQVEHPVALDRPQDREQRLAHAIRGGAG